MVKNYARGDFVREILSTVLFRNTNLSNAPFILNFRVEILKKSIPYIYLNPKTKRISPAVNRTPVSRVTGGDTHHYTTEELGALDWGLMGNVMGKRPIPL